MSDQLDLFRRYRPKRFEPHFNGPAYEPPRDFDRLSAQFWRIFALMRDTQWRTLGEIEQATGEPPASISAQLRHMRKARFGSHTVNKRHLGRGLWEYQVIPHE